MYRERKRGGEYIGQEIKGKMKRRRVDRERKRGERDRRDVR